MDKAALRPLLLPVVQEEEELNCDETCIQSSGQTPTAKRQRRLTLTAMTGLICELAQDQSGENASVSEHVQKDTHAQHSCLTTVSGASQDTMTVTNVAESCVSYQREASPVRRLKRSRASISATATAEVMAAQATRTLAATRLKSCDRGSRASANTSESSDSTEEEEDSLAVRVRRAQAFECGAQAVTDSLANAEMQSLADRQRDLSPGSKISFSQGVRAAQVAAKVAAKMASNSVESEHLQTKVAPSSTPARRNGPEVPSLSLQLRGGA